MPEDRTPKDQVKYGVTLQTIFHTVHIHVFAHDAETALENFEKALGAGDKFRAAEKQMSHKG